MRRPTDRQAIQYVTQTEIDWNGIESPIVLIGTNADGTMRILTESYDWSLTLQDDGTVYGVA